MMWRTYHFLLPLLSIFLVRVDLTDLIPLKVLVKDLEILDGDTVLVKFNHSSFRVRLLYIDAPERTQMHGSVDLGDFATKCLKKIIRTPVVLTIHGHDKYHRILGVLGNSSLEMVKNGCAYIYDYTKFESRAQKTRFLIEQNRAQNSRLGLWKFKVLNPRIHRQKRFKFQ